MPAGCRTERLEAEVQDMAGRLANRPLALADLGHHRGVVLGHVARDQDLADVPEHAGQVHLLGTGVPDVLGRDEAGAVRTLYEAALAAEIHRNPEPPSPDVGTRSGLVWKQFPAAGTHRAEGSHVRVWVNP